MRFQILGPLLAAPADDGELKARIEALAARPWRHPTTGETIRFSFKTLGRWRYIARGADDLPVERTRRATDKSEAALICDTATDLADAQAMVAREKANPSGVVDLVALHTDGQVVQAYTSILAVRKVLFMRDWRRAR